MPDLHETINQFLEGSIASIGRDPVIESKSITANGTYTAPEGVDGYSPITVNVPTPTPVIESKSITANGTYTAPEGVDGYSPITVNVPLPQNAYLLKSVANLPQAIASFNDGQEMVMPSLKVSIEPQQDLHGYDSPWVGGAGKNKLPLTVDLLKSENGGANTWNNNSKEINGITYTIQVDDNGNVIGINANGTATSNSIIYLMGASSPQIELSGQSVIISLGGFNRLAYKDNSWHDILSTSTESTVTLNGAVSQVWGQISNGVTVNNIVLKPMIRLASVTDATFAPYSNICPISGWDVVDVTVADDVETPTVSNVYTIDLDGTRYGGEVDVVNGIVTPAPYYASYNGETLTGEWISDRDKYEVGATPTIGAQVVNIGASGTPVSILPTAVKSLRGVNNVYANTGDIKDAEYFSKEG